MVSKHRVTTAFILTSLMFGCGPNIERDFTVEGAKGLFKERLYAEQLSNDERQKQKIQAKLQEQRTMPNRRQTLQIRVPVDESRLLTPFNASMVGSGDSLMPGAGLSGGRTLASRQRNVELKQRQLDQKSNDLKSFIIKMNREMALEEEGYRFEIEKIILATLIDLDNEIASLKEQTVIGFSAGNVADQLAFFGRNQLARYDQFVDLQESFLFVGSSMSTGMSVARRDELQKVIDGREMSINFSGLSLPVALESLAKSAKMSVYLSPALKASQQPVFLNVQRAETVDIFDILIDNYDIAMAYDISMSVARFFTKDEFEAHMRDAIAAATAHNRVAKIHRDKAKAEKQRAELFAFYEKYFKRVGEDARLESIESILTMDDQLTSGMSSTLLQIKEVAFNSQADISAKRAAYEADLRRLENEMFILEGQMEVINASLKRAEAQMGDDKMLASAGAQYNGAAGADAEMALFNDPLFSQATIVKDASLGTTEPVYTDRFTIYYQEADAIKSSLDSYFDQLYPEENPVVIQAEAVSMSSDGGAGTNSASDAAAPLMAELTKEPELLSDADFRPPKISTDKTAVVFTGLKPDSDLAKRLIEDLDIPAKQVLVEVFMVNVTRNWQRKLENSINAIPNFSGTSTTMDFVSNLSRQSLNNSIVLNQPEGDLSATINFMEENNIARTVSSPTVLAKDSVSASINRSVTRFREIIRQEPTGETNSVTGTPIFTSVTEYEPVEASLNLTVTPTINVLNDHVTLEINFEDSSFLGEDANSPQLSNNITTSMDAAPGDVIVLAGLYKESNQSNRESLPGLSGARWLGPIFGGSEDDLFQSDEMVIFLAPTVITPRSGVTPPNAVR